jgi:long-subunit acyl-CoA synthetase (AMP-forming)
LVHDKKLNSAVLKQLQDAGRKGGLAGFETVEGVVLADEEWTPQNVSPPIRSQQSKIKQDANSKYRASLPRLRNSTARAYCNSTRRKSTRHMAAHDRVPC